MKLGGDTKGGADAKLIPDIGGGHHSNCQLSLGSCQKAARDLLRATARSFLIADDCSWRRKGSGTGPVRVDNPGLARHFPKQDVKIPTTPADGSPHDRDTRFSVGAAA